LAVPARLCSNYIATRAITKKQKKIAQQPHKAVLAKAYIATAIGSRLTGPFAVIVARSELIDFERSRKTDSTFAF